MDLTSFVIWQLSVWITNKSKFFQAQRSLNWAVKCVKNVPKHLISFVIMNRYFGVFSVSTSAKCTFRWNMRGQLSTIHTGEAITWLTLKEKIQVQVSIIKPVSRRTIHIWQYQHLQWRQLCRRQHTTDNLWSHKFIGIYSKWTKNLIPTKEYCCQNSKRVMYWTWHTTKSTLMRPTCPSLNYCVFIAVILTLVSVIIFGVNATKTPYAKYEFGWCFYLGKFINIVFFFISFLFLNFLIFNVLYSQFCLM